MRLALLVLVLLCATGCPSEPPPPRPSPRPTPSAAAPATPVGSERGRALFQGTCAVCHGPKGLGLPGLGKDVTTSELVRKSSDDELVAFLVRGRAADHPDNSTGVPMPPRGGNASLSDDDLREIVAHLRWFSR
ncbi:MAG TPA: hypothetical protein DEA08_09025 [Planctomycetes bacterium]|nr:hypothetical protein [Planctomycetota bacterium]